MKQNRLYKLLKNNGTKQNTQAYETKIKEQNRTLKLIK